MEFKLATCPVCGNHYSQDDYGTCPVCAGMVKKPEEMEYMTEKYEFTASDSGTLPLSGPETERRPSVETEPGHTLPPQSIEGRPSHHRHSTPVGWYTGTMPPYEQLGGEGTGTMPIMDGDDQQAAPLARIVGWLVTLNGKNAGKDYIIRGFNSTIGRSAENTIALTGDATISRIANCSIRYYDETRNFFVYFGQKSTNPVYVNGAPLQDHTELHAYDVIRIGNTELLFLPLCGREFSWSGVKACR